MGYRVDYSEQRVGILPSSRLQELVDLKSRQVALQFLSAEHLLLQLAEGLYNAIVDIARRAFSDMIFERI